MITTFLFDLGGVLFTNGTKKFISSLSDQNSLPEEKVREVIDGEIGSLYREGKISRNEFWKRVIVALQLKETADELAKKWIAGYVIISGTKNIIEKLAKTYRIYYLSDNIKERADALEKKYHFKSMFCGGVFSHEAGVRKPNIKVYLAVLKKADAKPEETVFIDDKEKFLEPAKNIGIKTILFTSPQELEADLKKDRLI